jgi:hypothetical protein
MIKERDKTKRMKRKKWHKHTIKENKKQSEIRKVTKERREKKEKVEKENGKTTRQTAKQYADDRQNKEGYEENKVENTGRVIAGRGTKLRTVNITFDKTNYYA